jgi:opacity protein-like surface antigen
VKKLFPAIALLAVLLIPASSRAQDRFELFGGFSYVHAPVTFVESGVCITAPCTFNTHLNLNGYEFTAVYKPGSIFGIGADFGGYYGSSHGASTHINTYMAGPQVSFPGRISPFAHLFFGGAHESIGASDTFDIAAVSRNSISSALGAGIDFKILPFVAIRPIQIDYLVTRFNSDTQSQIRYSAGVVFHF